MSTIRYYCPLFLLLLAWTLLPSRVHGQEIEVEVSTYYLQISWYRLGAWLDVKDYKVTFTPEDSNICDEDIVCTTHSCTFNTLEHCGVVLPCTLTNISVSGNGYSSSLDNLITGPKPITDFSHYISNGVEYVSWANPSNETSPCYESTAVRLFFNGKEEITYFEDGEESMSRALCTKGYGEVEVWAEGGDGRSNSSLGTIIYNTSVVGLVQFESCEPVGCSSIEVQWLYNPVCPDVSYIEIGLDYDLVTQNTTVGTTKETVTGLEVNDRYRTCINAKDREGQILDFSCYSYCRTAYEVPRNLVVTSPNYYSLNASWDPPLCKINDDIIYELWANYDDYHTRKTHLTITALSEFEDYTVRLHVDRETSYEHENEISTVAFTLPGPPNVYTPEVYTDYIYVRWSFYVYHTHGFEFYYRVTWGKSQQHSATVKDVEYYNIRDYSSVDEVFEVCVVAVPEGREDLTSNSDCEYVNDDTDKPLSGGAIAGIVLAVLFVGILAGACVAYFMKKSKTAKRRRQQQQQHQMHQQPNYGVDNSGMTT